MKVLRALSIAALAALALAPAQAQPPAASVGAELQAQIAAARAAAALAPLEIHPALAEVAAWRAEQIAEHGREGDGSDVEEATSRLHRAGYAAHRWVEGSLVGAWQPDLLAAWRGVSPQWFEDAVLGDFEHLGVGTAGEGEKQVYAVLLGFTRRTHELRLAEPLRDLEEVRRLALEAVNAARREQGLKPVVANSDLDAAAQRHAEDQLQRGYYDHVSPEGSTPAERALRAGYRRKKGIAENIAKGLFTPAEAVERWLESSGHRSNILRRTAEATGLGVAIGESEEGLEILWVQMFGT